MKHAKHIISTLMAALVVICLTTVASVAKTPKMEERIGLDPALQGVWTIIATADANGDNVKKMDEPFQFAQVTASRVKFITGGEATFTKVMISEDNQGNPMNVALLSSGWFWFITKPNGQPFVLVQTVDPDGKQQDRWMITVN